MAINEYNFKSFYIIKNNPYFSIIGVLDEGNDTYNAILIASFDEEQEAEQYLKELKREIEVEENE